MNAEFLINPQSVKLNDENHPKSNFKRNLKLIVFLNLINLQPNSKKTELLKQTARSFFFCKNFKLPNKHEYCVVEVRKLIQQFHLLNECDEY